MKKILYILLALLSVSAAFSGAASAAPTVTASPASINVARGIPGTATIVYRVTQEDPGCSSQSSPSGTFFIPDENIGVNPIGITIPVVNTNGIATEILTVPIGVIERAIKKRTNRISYKRIFSGFGPCFHFPALSITINITGEADADFHVNRMDLYFENRRAEITVQRNTPNLKAFVDIRFTGTGLFEGDWKVDGRTIQHVSQHVTYGRTITLSSPEIPSLPTFNEGSHIVQFIITKPTTEITMPSIVYFVEPKEAKRIEPIRLLSPADRGAQDYASVKFAWEKLGKPFQYLIGFYETSDSGAIFSALTKDGSYTMPDTVLKKTFSKGKKYYWKVVAFEEESAVAGESKMQSFSIK
jgi:hypothetical protein